MPSAPGPQPGKKSDPFDDANVQRLRKLASNVLRKRGNPGDPSTMSLVDEVLLNFLRTQQGGALPAFDDEVELTKYLSRAIRNHLVSLARKRGAARRPPEKRREEWPESEVFPASQQAPSLVLDVNDALIELTKADARAAHVVELMFFGGCSQAEIATVLGATVDEVRGEWEYAKAWLRRRMSALESDCGGCDRRDQ